MGRIRTKDIKTVGADLWKGHANRFSTDFETNKTDVNRFGFKVSKRVRNKLAGYITRQKKIQAREAQ